MLDSINVEKDYEYKITSFMSKIKKNTYMKFIGKHDLNNAAGIHYTSQYEKDLSSKWKIKTENAVIPLGVDIPKSNIRLRGHKIAGVQEKLKTILFLSRLDPIKGIETLIETINILYQIRKDFNLIIGGSGTKEYELKLRKIIDDNGLNDVISMIGNVGQLDKNNIFENGVWWECLPPRNLAICRSRSIWRRRVRRPVQPTATVCVRSTSPESSAT